MTDARLSEGQITSALRGHLPESAQAGLRLRIFGSVEATSQQRPLPGFLGPLTDANPAARRRTLLLAAAILVALALVSIAAVGAWRILLPPDSLKVDIVPRARGLLAIIREGDLYLASPDGTGEVLAAHIDGVPLSDPRWSSDGRWIVVQTAEPAVLRLDPRTLEMERLAGGTIGATEPRGDAVALFTPDGDLAIVQIDTGAMLRALPRPAGSDSWNTVSWSPDGRWLVTYMRNDGQLGNSLVRIDVASGADETIGSFDFCCGFTSSWSPDSSRLAFVNYRERGTEPSGPLIVVATDRSGQVEAVPAGERAFDLEWSPDGAWIAYLSASDGAYRGSLNITRADGRDHRTLVTGGVFEIVGWRPDSLGIAFSAGDDGGRGELREFMLDTGTSGMFPVTGATDFAWALIAPTPDRRSSPRRHPPWPRPGGRAQPS